MLHKFTKTGWKNGATQELNSLHAVESGKSVRKVCAIVGIKNSLVWIVISDVSNHGINHQLVLLAVLEGYMRDIFTLEHEPWCLGLLVRCVSWKARRKKSYWPKEVVLCWLNSVYHFVSRQRGRLLLDSVRSSPTRWFREQQHEESGVGVTLERNVRAHISQNHLGETSISLLLSP